MGSGSGRGICLFYPTVAIFPLRMEELLGAKEAHSQPQFVQSNMPISSKVF